MKIRIVGKVLLPLLGPGAAACSVDEKEDGKHSEVDSTGQR